MLDSSKFPPLPQLGINDLGLDLRRGPPFIMWKFHLETVLRKNNILRDENNHLESEQDFVFLGDNNLDELGFYMFQSLKANIRQEIMMASKANSLRGARGQVLEYRSFLQSPEDILCFLWRWSQVVDGQN